MKILRDLSFGLLSALASGLIVLGAISLALVEGMSIQPPLLLELSTPTLLVRSEPQQQTQKPAIAPGVIETETPLPTPSVCPPPVNWVIYVIQPGDTVAQLAQAHSITPETLRDANCLDSDVLMPNYILYLPLLPPTNTPPSPPPTITPIPCGPPWGWVIYIVRPGDTLFRLSLAYGVSVPQIQFANCMGSSTYIRYGQTLYLPYVRPIRTAVPTATMTFTHTPTTYLAPTQTQVPLSSATFTATTVLSPTLTATSIPSSTFTATLAPTLTFTATNTPAPTDTNTPTPMPSHTPEPATESPVEPVD
jgi:LysM repeat protein